VAEGAKRAASRVAVVRRWLPLLAVLIVVVAFLLFVAPALATAPYQDTPDYRAISAIYSAERSPLSPETVAAYKYLHPEFDVAGFLAILKAESGLGTSCDYKHNPGSIKASSGSPWGALVIGRSPRGYAIYQSLYDGQRAAILLIATRYNRALAAHDWWSVGRYYGHGIEGYWQWMANVRAAHARYVKVGLSLGCAW
jgi:hypothetical protein